MNLMVIPVTYRLLTEPGPAMDEEFAFAQKHFIPVLPLMMDSGIDALYTKKFGDLQYLSPFVLDPTAIPYTERLKSFLSGVLVSDELAQRIRAAFDAYIFLSYRKKDRALALQLMREIHENADCRDIAIWYDEFLTPGEDFNELIDRAIEKSEFVTLLVTPNLVCEPNYVQSTEYPAAVSMGKEVLPAEMKPTDHSELARQYTGLPAPLLVSDEEAFRAGLKEAVKKIARTENGDPEHNFLIGMAYLDGVDMEINPEKGMLLITEAAEKGLPDAMIALSDIYGAGKGTERNLDKQTIWGEKALDKLQNLYGTGDQRCIDYQLKIAELYEQIGCYDDAQAIYEKIPNSRDNVYEDSKISISGGYLKAKYGLARIYKIHGNLRGLYDLAVDLEILASKGLKNKNGEEQGDAKESEDYSVDTLILSYELQALVLDSLCKYAEHLEVQKKILKLLEEYRGDSHPDTLSAWIAAAYDLAMMKESEKALELSENIIPEIISVCGEDSPQTLHALNERGIILQAANRYDEAQVIQEKIYQIRKTQEGEKAPRTLTALHNLAITKRILGKPDEAYAMIRKVYRERAQLFGENSPEAILSLEGLADCLKDLKNFEEAFVKMKAVYEYRLDNFGPRSSDTQYALSVLWNCAFGMGKEAKEYEKCLNTEIWVYEEFCGILGAEDDTPRTLLIEIKHQLDKYDEFLDEWIIIDLWRKLCDTLGRVLGENNHETLEDIAIMARCLGVAGASEEAIELYLRAYTGMRDIYGDNDFGTLLILRDLAYMYSQTGKMQKAYQLGEQAWQGLQTVYGQLEKETIEALDNLVWYCYMLQDWDNGLPLAKLFLEDYVHTFGPHASKTLDAYAILGMFYLKLGNKAAARRIGEEIAEYPEEALSERTLDILPVLLNAE